jgi:hypothetical protein
VSYDEKAKGRTTVRWPDGGNETKTAPAASTRVETITWLGGSGGDDYYLVPDPFASEIAAYEAELAKSDSENEALRQEIDRLQTLGDHGFVEASVRAENEALRAEVQRFAVEALVAEGDAMELHAEVQRLLKREKELEGKVTGRDIALAQERAEVQRLRAVIQRAWDAVPDDGSAQEDSDALDDIADLLRLEVTQ